MPLKVNPRLEAIAKAGSPKRSDVVILRGLVAKADRASIDIRVDVFGSSAYTVSTGDVISSSENTDGSVSLLVRGDAPVTIQTTAGVLQGAKDNLVVAKDNATRPPTQSEIDDCKKRMRDSCIESNMILKGRTRREAEASCDDEQVAGLRDAICSSPVAVREIRAARDYLGAEIVSDVFD